jgi:hypothetical protein
MDIKIIILTALIGIIAAVSHLEQAAQRKRPARQRQQGAAGPGATFLPGGKRV